MFCIQLDLIGLPNDSGSCVIDKTNLECGLRCILMACLPHISLTGETEWGAQDSVKYELKVRCTKNPLAATNDTDLDNLYLNRKGKDYSST